MIDWGRVAELREEVGEDAFAEVVAMFLEEVDAAIAGLRGDLSASALAAEHHAIKGAALNLGLRDVSTHCEAAEERAAAGLPDPADVDLVSDSYRQSRTVFLAGLLERFGLRAA